MIKKQLKKIEKMARNALHGTVGHFGYQITKNTPRYYLHDFASYEEYRDIQVEHNKRKIERVWADEETLSIIADRVNEEFDDLPKGSIFGLCHGARNGFEQKVLQQKIKKSDRILGTDISETATDFENSVHWDFHDENPDWLGKCHVIYTNSLDQSWKPSDAVRTWVDQLVEGGMLFIEHTKAHSASGASEMDPFGADPYMMPYLLSEWLGHKASIEIIKTTKTLARNNETQTMDLWLFVVKKTPQS